jgi:bacterioferritin-associated ferredoxin
MIVCNCKQVTAAEIKQFAKKHPVARFDDLKRITGVASGCGRCAGLAQKTFEKIKAELPSQPQIQLNLFD